MNLSLVVQRLRRFNTVFDDRFEDLTRANWPSIVYRDFSAGLIVALTAIPMAMGFAIAMGLRPEMGIVAGAVACLVGRTFGGSKYQVYGPTAAFIPVLAAVVTKYGPDGGGTIEQAHGILVAGSLAAGVILMLMGLSGLGRYAKLVPNSIVVGFTVGIAVTIALSNLGEALGLRAEVKGGLVNKLRTVATHLHEVNWYAVGLAALTFVMSKGLLRVSVFIPAPLLALLACTLLAQFAFPTGAVKVVRDQFGSIPSNFFAFTPPALPPLTAGILGDLAYLIVAIVFVSAVESLLCSSMADRLANNRKTPFNPDKEFWGQGLVQIVTPLVNGFPCTGALARTATSIKAGAVTPLAGYFKGVLKLLLAYFLAPYLEQVPMAAIGGILIWVASNMIKVAEIREVLAEGRFHTFLMLFTAVAVPATDFLTGVLAALVLHFTLGRWLARPAAGPVGLGVTKSVAAEAGDEPTN